MYCNLYYGTRTIRTHTVTNTASGLGIFTCRVDPTYEIKSGTQ